MNSGWALKILAKIGWRYLVYHRWQSLLMILGVALGVAVVVAIDLANASASRSFELSTETVSGKTTHQIQGGIQGVREELFVDLIKQGIVDLAAPVINEYITSPQLGSYPVQMLGIDPFADGAFRGFLGQVEDSDGPDLAELSDFLVQPGAILISQSVADRNSLQVGDELDFIVKGYARKAHIVGVLSPQDKFSQRTLDGIVLTDISTAQELTGAIGWLSYIELIFPDNETGELENLKDWLPMEYKVVPVSSRTDTIKQMTAAFELNLSALSMLALVVGLFLIYNTMTFSVVQRRGLFGALRCLGMTRREVFFLVVSESVLVGVIGGILGIGLGLAMGQVTIGMVSQTVNDLYFSTTARSVGVAPESLIKGGLVGLFATVLAAILPAWEAASIPPRAAMLRSGLESKARLAVGQSGLLGLLLGGVGAGLFYIPSTSLLVGFGGITLVVVGFALFSSVALVALMRGMAMITGRFFGLVGRMAPRNLVNSLSRTSVAVAALMVAVAVAIGVGLMIDSFRGTVIVWLEQTLQSDIYVSVPDFTATRSSTAIDPDLINVISNWPGVDRVDSQRSVIVESEYGSLNLSATENPELGLERDFLSLSTSVTDVWKKMQLGNILISEPLANRIGMKEAGEEIILDTPIGRQAFLVIGIYHDYASSEGTILMSLDFYRNIWQDNSLTALGLRLSPGIDPDQLSFELMERVGTQQQLLIRPNQTLRDDVLEVFDRTFAITVALRVLATVVAFIGVLNALLLLQMEKQREVGILRALGFTGQQLWKMVMLETGLMGLTAGLLALPAGYTLAYILVYVINRRSFGWTLQLMAEPDLFVQGLLVSVVAALIAGLYPALRMSRMLAAEAIRNE